MMVVWSDESFFRTYHANGGKCVCNLHKKDMAPGCIMGGRQASGGSVIFWAMFCRENLGSDIQIF